MKQEDFYGLGLAPTLLERLDDLGFKHPTPIQFKAIPIGCRGEDVVGIAQTGTGKTLSFSLPMLQQMSRKGKMGLVLLPTRELAIQVQETLEKLAKPLGLRTALIMGGVKPGRQIKELKQKPHVIVATPGRLIDLMEQKIAKLDKVGVLVLDEADRMLDMGFAPQLKRILAQVPKDRQTLLFSATMPEQIASIARQYMKSPLRIEVAPAGTTADRVDQEMFIVPRAEKVDLLGKLLEEYTGTILVFSRTKHGAKKLARTVRKMGHTATEIHGNRSQKQRQESLKGFSNGKFRVMVATDIAARGIDVKNIELVINYDLPDQLEDYVHRIGRTGRAGRSGKAISFAAPEQKKDVIAIEKLIQTTIPLKTKDGEEIEREEPKPHKGGGRSGSGRRRSGGGGSRGRGGKRPRGGKGRKKQFGGGRRKRS